LAAVIVGGGLFLFGGLLHWAGSTGIPGDSPQYEPVDELPDGYDYTSSVNQLRHPYDHNLVEGPGNASDEERGIALMVVPGTYVFNGSDEMHRITFKRPVGDIVNEVFPLVLMAIGILLPIGIYGWQRLMKEGSEAT
jgi:hypothetical protein